MTSIKYLLQDGGDGFIMSGKCEIYQDMSVLDIEVVKDYISKTLGGVIPEQYRNPEGDGRIRIIDGSKTPEKSDDSEKESSVSGTSLPERSDPSMDDPQDRKVPSAIGTAQPPATGVPAAAAQAAGAAVVISVTAIAVLTCKKKKT